jgi:hypothetical protein
MDQITEAEAASLALALVAVATATVDGEPEAQDEGERGLVEVVEGLCDVPLTERQASVVECIGTASAALTAGLGSALADEQGSDVQRVLGLAARAVIDHAGDGGHRAA